MEKPVHALTFLSTQMNPVEEAGKMRNIILKDFPGKVDFRPNDSSFVFSQIDSLLRAHPSESILIGSTHGDLVSLFEKKALRPLDTIFSGLTVRDFPEALVKLSRLDGNSIYYIPWMQASFVMAANKKALEFLPEGAGLDALTYEQLYQWAKNIYAGKGIRALGFPAGRKGLMHRFLQGYLYPSYTASTLLKFRTEEAYDMWGYLKGLWGYVHPSSLVYSSMAEPLLTEEVWIAWDHTARLIKVFEKQPNDFIAFPSPIGPKGRGFMAVISGLAIPADVADTYDPAILIDYLTRSAIQNRTMRETGFFPAILSAEDDKLPSHLQELKSAVDKQMGSPVAIPTLLPIGLGEHGDDYNDLFMFTFSEIVLESKHIQTILDANAKELQRILDAQNLKCWLPDISEERPCKIE